jgi:hypothetical protein
MRTRVSIALALALLSLVLAVGVALADHDGGGGVPLTATLTGAAEVPGPGDPDGSGTAQLTLNPGLGEVCFALSVANITLPATGAHIHVNNPATGFGPVVVPLTPPGASGTSSGCVTNVDRNLILAIIHNPENYYVNVHTLPLYGAGAVRGQLAIGQ